MGFHQEARIRPSGNSMRANPASTMAGAHDGFTSTASQPSGIRPPCKR